MSPENPAKKLWRTASSTVDAAQSKIDDIVRSPDTAKAVSDLEATITRRRHNERLEDGTLRGVHLAVHRGYVLQGRARVHVRVVETPKLPDEGSRIPYWDVVNANLRRHAVLAFPDVTVRVHLNEFNGEGVTDRHGYASVVIEVPDALPAGWHEVRALTVGDGVAGTEFSDTGRVIVPDPGAEVAVVSDLDDTVIRTGLDEGLVALRRTLFRDAHTRRAVPGMASLYRGIQRGARGADGDYPPDPPFFYLSTGTWSFYEMLTQFLQLRGYPRGPLFLTDWGPTEKYLHRSGREHKTSTLARLREGLPDTPLVLIGDSGQHDPEIYVDFARENPGSTRMILIMQASDASAQRTDELRDQAIGLRREGVPLYVAENALEAAEFAASLKLCDSATLEEVETEMGAVF